MTDPNTTRSSRRRKKTVAKVETPKPEVENKLLEVIVTEEVEASPIVEPAPEPTPIPEPEPKLVKPWELVRPMPLADNNTWPRSQKWRP